MRLIELVKNRMRVMELVNNRGVINDAGPTSSLNVPALKENTTLDDADDTNAVTLQGLPISTA